MVAAISSELLRFPADPRAEAVPGARRLVLGEGGEPSRGPLGEKEPSTEIRPCPSLQFHAEVGALRALLLSYFDVDIDKSPRSCLVAVAPIHRKRIACIALSVRMQTVEGNRGASEGGAFGPALESRRSCTSRFSCTVRRVRYPTWHSPAMAKRKIFTYVCIYIYI